MTGLEVAAMLGGIGLGGSLLVYAVAIILSNATELVQKIQH